MAHSPGPYGKLARFVLHNRSTVLVVVTVLVLISLVLGLPPKVDPNLLELLPDDDVGGLAVHIGARVSSLAGPGEVLVSSTVRDLVVGSGQTLTDRGEHELKGVPGPWRIFAAAG